MQANHCILAVDAGTGDCRVMAYSLSGSVLAEEHTEWFYLPDADSGYYAFDPEKCILGILDMIRRVVAKLPGVQILAVTVTSQRDGMAFLDQNDHEVYCAPNLDLRGDEVMDVLKPWEQEILQATGLPLHAMFGLPRLVWFREKKPDVYAQIHCVMMLSDWVAFRLSGAKRSEIAAASTSQMLNLKRCGYDPELMCQLGLKTEIFPQTCYGTEIIGTIKTEIAQFTGLEQQIPVLIAGSDAHCAAVGMGCFRPGDFAVIAGSTTPILAVLDHAVIDPEGCLYSSPASLPGQWTLEGNADSTGLSYRWLRNLLYTDPITGRVMDDAYTRMEADAAEIPAGANGMSAYVGIGIRNVKKGMNFGGFSAPIPWNIDEYKKGHFVRALLESNAYAVAANIELIEACAGQRPAFLRVCGGQTASDIWCQTLASATGLPVCLSESFEATTLGAVLLAAVGCGCYTDLEAAAEAMVRMRRVVEPECDEGLMERYAEWKKRYVYLLDYDEHRKMI